jgi:hypothetical protein
MLISTGLMILLLAGGDAWAKDQVERPFKIQAASTMVLNPDYSYRAEGEGVATHCGRVSMVGWGKMGAGGSGVITTANGDEINFDDAPSGVVTIDGGTGRFEGAKGEFTIAILSQQVEGATITYTWTGTGTITY